jgi:catechol 2,3-dioxygenase-like lactoylglutathione lyase family enzyme
MASNRFMAWWIQVVAGAPVVRPRRLVQRNLRAGRHRRHRVPSSISRRSTRSPARLGAEQITEQSHTPRRGPRLTFRALDAVTEPRSNGRTFMEMKLEVVVVPVSDVERAKRFYEQLGWRLDADFVTGPDFRAVQFTPPGSMASIHFGKGLTPSAPGSLQGLYLVVSDIEAARAELIGRGVAVSEVFHRTPGTEPLPGPDPERRSYASFAGFSDPDGNGWLLQEIRQRLPGR